MAMRMLPLWKNPRSTNFWLRRRVPAAFMGKKEIKLSLNTSDPKLAEIRCAEENAKLEQRRIVGKLDNLTGRTARARDELGRIPTLVQKYRDAILAKAFGGE